MIEFSLACQWARALLLADGAVSAAVGQKIFQTIAPQGTATPYLVLREGATMDVPYANGRRIYTRLQIMLDGIDRPAYATALAKTMWRADQALQDKSGEIAATADTPHLVIAGCRRVSTQDAVEPGDAFKHLGGTYELDVYTT